MAEFNPSPQPTQDPNYIFWSRPAREQPRGDESGKILAEGTGNLIKEGTNTADQYIKRNLETDIYGIVDKERGDFTQALEQVKGGQSPQVPTTQTSLVPPEQTAPPADVKKGVQDVQNLQAAKDGGKINETLYWQRLIPKLQALRTDNPGYRDYIDQKTHEITGQNPANAYMRSLVADINQQREKQDSVKKRSTELIYAMGHDGDPHAAQLLQAYQSGKVNDAQVLQAASESFSYKRYLEMKRVENADRETHLHELSENRAERADKEAKDEQDVRKIYTTNVSNSLNMPIIGAGQGVTMQQIFDKARTLGNPANWDSNVQASAENYSRQLELGKAGIIARARQDILFAGLNNVKPEAIQAAEKEALDVVDAYQRFLTGKESYPLSTAYAQGVKAIKDKDQIATLTDPTVGPFTRKMSVLQETAKEALPMVYQSMQGTKDFTQGMFTYTLSNIADLWGNDAVNKDNSPFSFGTKLNSASTQLPAADVPQVANSYLKQVDAITDRRTPDQAKVNLADKFFNPTTENLQAITKFDPKSQWQVFTKLSAPDVTRQIVKMANRHDPMLLEHYQTTMENWFTHLVKNRVIPEITNAEQSYGQPNQSAYQAAQRGRESTIRAPMSYYWDSDHTKMGISPESLRMIKEQHPNDWQSQPIIQSVAKFNIALKNMAAIYKNIPGADVNSLLLQLVQKEGIQVGSPTQEANEHQFSWGKLGNAIAAAFKPQQDVDTSKEVEEEYGNRNQ